MSKINEKKLSNWMLGAWFLGLAGAGFLVDQHNQDKADEHLRAIEDAGGVLEPAECDVVYSGSLHDRYTFDVEATVCDNNTATYEVENTQTGTVESIIIDFNSALGADVMQPNSLRFAWAYKSAQDDLLNVDFLESDPRYHAFANEVGVLSCLALEEGKDLGPGQQETAQVACNYVKGLRDVTEKRLREQMRLR